MLRNKTALFVAAIGVCALGLSSCSNKATEEQMKTLRDLDRQRDGLQSELDRAQGSLRDVKGKLATHDRDLKDCNDDTQFARTNLALWPNVWPDSTDWMVAPPPAPAPAKRRTGGAVRKM